VGSSLVDRLSVCVSIELSWVRSDLEHCILDEEEEEVVVVCLIESVQVFEGGCEM